MPKAQQKDKKTEIDKTKGYIFFLFGNTKNMHMCVHCCIEQNFIFLFIHFDDDL